MSPSGIPPEWSSSDYFDDDDADWPIRNITDLREAVQKCLATATRSDDDLADHVDALHKAAARLNQTVGESQYLYDASVNLTNAVEAVEHARALLDAAIDYGGSYLTES